MIVNLTAPAFASDVPYFRINLGVSDGKVSVPAYMVPTLLAAGCKWQDGEARDVDIRAEIAAADRSDLRLFPVSRKVKTFEQIDGRAPNFGTGEPAVEPMPDDDLRVLCLAIYDAENPSGGTQ